MMILDHAQRALREFGAAIHADPADAGVLDPYRRPAAAALGEETILDAVLDLGLGPDLGPPGDRVIAGTGVLGIDEEGKGAAAQWRPLGQTENRAGICGPGHLVGRKVPAVSGLAYGLEDPFEVELSRPAGVGIASLGLVLRETDDAHVPGRLALGPRGRPTLIIGMLLR